MTAVRRQCLLHHGQPDTARFLYAALVVAVDSGMAILLEHETLRDGRNRAA